MGEKPRPGNRLEVGVGAGLWGAGPMRGGAALETKRTLSGAWPPSFAATVSSAGEEDPAHARPWALPCVPGYSNGTSGS